MIIYRVKVDESIWVGGGIKAEWICSSGRTRGSWCIDRAESLSNQDLLDQPMNSGEVMQRATHSLSFDIVSHQVLPHVVIPA